MGRSSAVAAIAALVLLTVAACVGPGDGAGTDGWVRISPQQLEQRLRGGDVYLVNVHVPYQGEIPGTDAFIPYTQIKERLDELPGDASTLVLYCRSGSMSTDAARDLVAAGVTGFAELDGGFNAWRAAGLPLEVKPGAGQPASTTTPR